MHFIAMMMAILVFIPLLIKAKLASGSSCMLAMAIFIESMILLYEPVRLITQLLFLLQF